MPNCASRIVLLTAVLAAALALPLHRAHACEDGGVPNAACSDGGPGSWLSCDYDTDCPSPQYCGAFGLCQCVRDCVRGVTCDDGGCRCTQNRDIVAAYPGCTLRYDSCGIAIPPDAGVCGSPDLGGVDAGTPPFDAGTAIDAGGGSGGGMMCSAGGGGHAGAFASIVLAAVVALAMRRRVRARTGT